TAIAAFGIGNMVQANSISAMVVETFGVSPWITGPVMTACTAVVILGGIKSIANVCEKLVPFMAVFYIVGCTILLVMHAAAIPETVRLIVSTAFTGQAAVGGFVGAGAREAIRYGEKAAEYLFGVGVIMPYRVLWVAAVMVGSVVSLPAVWSFADIANGFMAIPNLFSLIALSGVIVAETREHLWDQA